MRERDFYQGALLQRRQVRACIRRDVGGVERLYRVRPFLDVGLLRRIQGVGERRQRIPERGFCVRNISISVLDSSV